MTYRHIYKKYILIAGVLLLLLSTPAYIVGHLRGKVMATLFYFFKGCTSLIPENSQEEMRLEGENHLLRIEIGKLRALLEQQISQISLQEQIQIQTGNVRRYEELKFLSDKSLQALPARVIFRDPSSWSSSFWVDVGEKTNQAAGALIVQKNSPVILGRSLVGVVDYVGQKQSQIRLITDVALNPSVRAVRGFPQNAVLVEQVDSLIRHVQNRQDLSFPVDEKILLLKSLEKLKQKLHGGGEGKYLAKGILKGSGSPLWRSVNQTLCGIGFNYDWADDEGPARELTTGKPIHADGPSLPLIQAQDLLVTTGLDGVFPPGLRVAEVTKVHPLREGAYTYEIEAIPIVNNLSTLHTVFIIPPVGYDHEET